MPSPYFDIVRVEGRYPNDGIVCGQCFRPLRHDCHYEVERDGNRPNSFPFHTVRCAENWILRYMQFTEIHPIINRCSDEYDDTQEEATED